MHVFFELHCAYNCIYQEIVLHNLFILYEVIIKKRCAIERVFIFHCSIEVYHPPDFPEVTCNHGSLEAAVSCPDLHLYTWDIKTLHDYRNNGLL